jgi:hypothetical protein
VLGVEALPVVLPILVVVILRGGVDVREFLYFRGRGWVIASEVFLAGAEAR